MGYYLGVLVKGLVTGSFADAFLDGNSFNYVLVAMALGGTFLVPSLRSALLAAIGVAATPFILDAAAAIGRSSGVPPFTLPFCLITLGAVAALRAAKYSLAGGHGRRHARRGPRELAGRPPPLPGKLAHAWPCPFRAGGPYGRGSTAAGRTAARGVMPTIS